MTRKVLLPLLGLLLFAVGCSDNSVEPANTNGLNLTDQFGGYTAASESPAFGDATLETETVDNAEEFNDPIMLSGEIDSLVADPDAGYYHFRTVWGQLRFDSASTSATDWTGSLSISRGAIIVRRLIHFEILGQDYIVPRTSRDLVEWVSQTTVHNDGLALDLYVPPVPPILDSTVTWVVDSLGDSTQIITVDTTIVASDPVTLTFTTGPYSRTFGLDELVALDTVVELADGNAVAFDAFRLDRMPCPRGFLAGRWGYDEEGNGRFKGVWMSKRGEITGYLRGHFGTNDLGEDVFFGKWVERSGRFAGFVRGEWNSHPDPNSVDNAQERAGGGFSGAIFNADRMPIGVMHGRFRSADDDDKGFFQGRWKLRCDDAEPPGIDGEEGF